MAVTVARRRLPTASLYGLLVVLSVIWLVPVVGAVMMSLRPLAEIRQGWWNLGGATFGLGNYAKAWTEGLSGFAFNSFVITVGSVALTVAAGTLAAYAFARLRFRGRRVTYFLLITTMIVPVQLILIPLLPWFRTIGLSEGPWQYVDFIFVWNDLLLALTLLGRDYQPIQVGLANLQSPHLAQQDIVSAGAIMAILPPLVLFVALNRFYVRGLFAGGTKG